METIEHFAKISLVARLLGGENVLAREEVSRLQELRGTYGIKAPAPICADGTADQGASGGAAPEATCQVVQAPAGGGLRLVAEATGAPERLRMNHPDAEIRLTYRELSALIEDAIKSLG
jgi:L-fuculose-phosphate aldolase